MSLLVGLAVLLAGFQPAAAKKLEPGVSYLVKFVPGAASQERKDAVKAAKGKKVASIAALGIELVEFPAAIHAEKSACIYRSACPAKEST